MFKPILFSAILFALLPASLPVQASNISIGMPGLSISIGDRDRYGNYWDGYDWRNERWWHDHQGRYRGERNRHGYYWDGHYWRNSGWWNQYQRPPNRAYYSRPDRHDNQRQDKYRHDERGNHHDDHRGRDHH
jgi:hypothetical protein